MRWCMQVLRTAVVLYAVATLCSVAVFQAMTMRWETVAAAFAVPLLALPAIVAYAVCAHWGRARRFAPAVYCALLLAVLGPLLWAACFPSLGAAADGADQMAWAIAFPLLAAGITALLAGLRLARAAGRA